MKHSESAFSRIGIVAFARLARAFLACSILGLAPASLATVAADCETEWQKSESAQWCQLGPAGTTVENPEDGDRAICHLEVTCPKPGVADLPQRTARQSLALDCVNTLHIVDDRMTLGSNCN